MNEELVFIPAWVGVGKLMLVVKLGATVLFTGTCDPANQVSRQRMLTALAEEAPKVSQDVVRKFLMELAAEERPAQQTVSTKPSPLPKDPPPADQPVNGAELLDQLRALLRKYMVLPAGADVVVALWIAATWCMTAWSWFPRLLVSSAVMRSGKTRLLRMVWALAAKPLLGENMSTATLFRLVEGHHPTLVLDECDAWLASHNADEGLRNFINSGTVRGAKFWRCEGDSNEPRGFDCYAAAALGMIGMPKGTIIDRSVIVRMQRRAQGETIERLPAAYEELRVCWSDIVAKLTRWAIDNVVALRAAYPTLPAGLGDRAADNWRPLLAVADAAGGEWPSLAGSVAAGAAHVDGEEEAGIRLLRDLRDLFKAREMEGASDRASTATVLQYLVGIEEAPWATYRNGHPLNPYGLSRLLNPFGVGPKDIRTPTGTVKGYNRVDLAKAWSRYLPPDKSATGRHPSNGAVFSAGKSATNSATDRDGVADHGGGVADAVADQDAQKPSKHAGCRGVADPGGSGSATGSDEDLAAEWDRMFGGGL